MSQFTDLLIGFVGMICAGIIMFFFVTIHHDIVALICILLKRKKVYAVRWASAGFFVNKTLPKLCPYWHKDCAGVECGCWTCPHFNKEVKK